MKNCDKVGPHGQFCLATYGHRGMCTWERDTPTNIPDGVRSDLKEPTGGRPRPAPNLAGKVLGATALAIVTALVLSACVWAIVEIWKAIL